MLDENRKPVLQRSSAPLRIADEHPRGRWDDRDALEYISLFHRRRWTMLAVGLPIFAIGMAYTLIKPPVYESSATIVVANRSALPVSENSMPVINDLQALKGSQSVETEAAIISSPDLLDEAFRSITPESRAEGFGSVRLPSWACEVTRKPDTDLITITTKALRPRAAAELANAVAETYFKRDLERNNRATRQARLYAEQKMIEAGRQLAAANRELSEFKKRSGFFAPDTQMTKTADSIASLSLDLDAARAEAISHSRKLSVLAGQLGKEQGSVVASTTLAGNPQYSTLLEKIDDLHSERLAVLQEYTPDAPEVRAIDDRISQEEKRLDSVARDVVSSKVHARNPIRDALLANYAAEQAALAASNGQVRTLRSELAARKHDAGSLPERERMLVEHSQRVALLQRTYEMLSGNYNTLLLSEQATIPSGMLVSAGQPPTSSAYPNKAMNSLFFLMVGSILAVIAAVASEQRDKRIYSPDILESASGLAILSAVPEMAHDKLHLHKNTCHDGKVLESFRILRNSISCGMECKVGVLAVTSPSRREGKSTAAANLAVAAAMEGKRILLVDADMRRPSLHRLLNTPSDKGLSTVLSSESGIAESIVPTCIEGVSFMPSGPIPPNPTELLNSDAGRSLFKQLRAEYDLVVIDCPPTVGLGDVQVISGLVDGVAMVVSMNRTLRPQLEMALSMLYRVGAPLIGLIVNRMPIGKGSYGYYCSYDDSLEEERDPT